MDSPNYYLESLLRGTKMGSNYSIDMCINDLKAFYFKPAKEGQVYENEVDYLLDIICEQWRVTKADVLSKSRKRDVVNCRHMFCKLVVKDFRCMTLKTCGKFIGDRDHSTVINSINQCNNIYDWDRFFTMQYDEIKCKFEDYLKGNDKPTDTNK